MSLRASLYPGVIAIAVAVSGTTFLVREPAIAWQQSTPATPPEARFLTVATVSTSGSLSAEPGKVSHERFSQSPVEVTARTVAVHAAVKAGSAPQPEMHLWLLTLGGGLTALLLAWRRLSD